MAAPASTRPEVGDILMVVHDFQARSSDELTLVKGDRIELMERDDEFGDGWFLGRHIANGNSGLFPEVYTRPAPKTAGVAPTPKPNAGAASASEASGQREVTASPTPPAANEAPFSPSIVAPKPAAPTQPTLPLSSIFASPVTSPPTNTVSSKSPPTLTLSGIGDTTRPSTSQDSHVLHETLNVIDEHITDFNSPQLNDSLRVATNDSESEYSSHIGHRLSYIQGEETDEEEEGVHSRAEVMAWSADDVAEYLFTSGVEKRHCEVFRDQEITGEVLLGMDQTSLFIKAFDLGPVGRRLKTWQKIKSLQDEVSGQGPSSRRTTQEYAGSDAAGRARSRTGTLRSSIYQLPSLDDRPVSIHGKRMSLVQNSKAEPTQPMAPGSPLMDSPTRHSHEKRPSAASVRDLHHSRRYSSADYRVGGAMPEALPEAPELTISGIGDLTQQPRSPTVHKKQPSFDRNWTLRGATAHSQRPLSSAGPPSDAVLPSHLDPRDTAADLDRGYFSGTDADPKRRNVLRKRDSAQKRLSQASYTEEQRVRAGTALSRHSRFGSVDSVRDSGAGPSPAAQKYYGLMANGPHRRTASSATTESIRPIPPAKDTPPAVTVLSGPGPAPDAARASPITPASPSGRPVVPGDWSAKPGMRGAALGLRAISDAVTGSERSKVASSDPSSYKESPVQSPTRTGSTTPSGGPSFELDSPTATRSPVTPASSASRNGARKKTKQETSAYLRGLQKVSPSEATVGADYSGWMKKKSSHLMTTWKPRLFVLKGRRLAYYYSEDDDQEKGLIDISFHRVLPAGNEKLTGLHATLTGASNTPTRPTGSSFPTLAATQADADPSEDPDSIFIFKLVPPRAGLSRAVNFTKPTVHYFAVPNIKQGRLWMAALMKATIDRDDTQPITSTYQQKTITLAKAQAMHHRPPNLMNLAEASEESLGERGDARKEGSGLGIVYDGTDSGVSGLDKPNGSKPRGLALGDEKGA